MVDIVAHTGPKPYPLYKAKDIDITPYTESEVFRPENALKARNSVSRSEPAEGSKRQRSFQLLQEIKLEVQSGTGQSKLSNNIGALIIRIVSYDNHHMEAKICNYLGPGKRWFLRCTCKD